MKISMNHKATEAIPFFRLAPGDTFLKVMDLDYGPEMWEVRMKLEDSKTQDGEKFNSVVIFCGSGIEESNLGEGQEIALEEKVFPVTVEEAILRYFTVPPKEERKL